MSEKFPERYRPKLLEDVAWFPFAQISSDPEKAVVRKVHGDGTVDLHVIGRPGVLNHVRHVEDPEATRIKKQADRLGAWERLTIVQDRQRKEESLAADKRVRDAEAAEAQKQELAEKWRLIEGEAVKLAEQKMPVPEICRKLQRDYKMPVDYPRVNKALREAGLVGAV